MELTFLETRQISEDGHNLRRCEKGKTYEIADTAACHALRMGWAFNSMFYDRSELADVVAKECAEREAAYQAKRMCRFNGSLSDELLHAAANSNSERFKNDFANVFGKEPSHGN